MKRITRLTLTILAAVLACPAFWGCGADVSASPGLGDPVPPPFNSPEISMLSPELQKWLAFQPAVIADDGKRPMQVQVPVRNLTTRLYLIDYRLVFYDEQGMELEPLMGWRRQELRPKQLVTLKGAAMTTAARRYRLEVKWAR
jgi:uncharacterized protein YcfL